MSTSHDTSSTEADVAAIQHTKNMTPPLVFFGLTGVVFLALGSAVYRANRRHHDSCVCYTCLATARPRFSLFGAVDMCVSSVANAVCFGIPVIGAVVIVGTVVPVVAAAVVAADVIATVALSTVALVTVIPFVVVVSII